jgi:hypothetical protein
MTVPSPAPIKPVITQPLNVIVATDCGSTTTKAILIEKVGDEYRQTYRGEAPTTVEAPFEDVTRGVLNAIAEIEELSGRRILDGDKILTPNRAAQGDPKTGVDIYISTSSAGGGLQMMVTGVVQNMTGESAQRAALGAGAIVIDVLASNDGRLPHEKIERIRTMRPDMILMSGGTDGGAVTHVVEMAEYISAADGVIMETIAKREHLNLIGVDIGGATTDVFSVFEGHFNRTVSANLGMSYSISNVLAETGLANIMRWVPFTIDEQTLRNRIKNKMVRPTTIPQTLDELQIEHAIAREALRLALIHHKSLATALKGVQQERTISDVFEQQQSGKTLIDMLKLDLIVGSGGILSHAPRRVQSMLMMVDAYEPLGVTRLSVDSIFMMPHLGVLSTIDEKAATDVFVRDCMVYLGTCVAPIGQGKDGERCADYAITFPDGRVDKGALSFGDLRLVPLASGQKASITIQPAKQVNLGAGAGVAVTREVQGGVVGLLLDGRGRPLQLPTDHAARVASLTRWYQAVDLYPISDV